MRPMDVGSANALTYLERDKPYAFQCVADNEQILHGPQGRHVNADI